ncbi:MAG: chorismate-binding protein, partial [Odoribacter sp.]|nr:chorismate-binding protein [Odoribacter sp.]
MKADLVRKEINRCGSIGTPFLFGVDFEKINGFFIENPMENASIPFSIGEISNVVTPTTSIARPKLEILHTDAEAYRKKFAIVRQGLLHGDSFLLNLTERTPIKTNLTLEEIFRYSRAKYKLLLPDHCVCFSPESFVQIKNGEIFSYPMKGPLDATLPQADQLLM